MTSSPFRFERRMCGVSLDVERSLEKCMVRMMDLTDGKFGVLLPRLETKNDNIKETLRK